MQIGMIGLGKMGANMTRRLAGGGHEVVVQDVSVETARTLASQVRGVDAAGSPRELLAKLKPPRAVWLMVPAGKVVDGVLADLKPGLAPGDVVIDGGNSNYKDSQRRAKELAEKEIHFVDAGTSGGVWGLEVGYCLMVGGHPSAIARVQPAHETLAPPGGWAHVGASGAGHFSKMVHNGIEYGLMESYAEGFEILKASGFGYDLAGLAGLWGKGSVVRSWLLELAERALRADPELAGVKGWVEDSGEGRWTVQEAMDRDVPAPVITASLLKRIASRQEDAFSDKLTAALRNQFGGHAVKKA
jgi:6-phosphogluconate dehydrogenase